MELVLFIGIVLIQFLAIVFCVTAAICKVRLSVKEAKMEANRKELRPERIIEDFDREQL